MSHLAKKCIFRLKKVPKRFGESEKVATFATALREKHSSKAKKQVLKIFEKFLQKDLEKRKTCLTFATAFASKTKATFWKKSLKNLSKRFGGLKKMFYLCTTFRYEKAVKLNEVFEPHRIESVLIEIYKQRSLKLLSSKVFIHSKEWFQTIPLRLELKI